MQPPFNPSAPWPGAPVAPQYSGPAVFAWSYMIQTIHAQIDPQFVQVKMGLRTQRVEVARLRQLYVRRSNMGNGYCELVLAYEAAPGRRKLLRAYADLGQMQFDAFVRTLLSLRPDIDIRQMDAKSAYKLMGAMNHEKLAVPIVAVLVLGVMGLICAPHFVHAFDGGEQSVTADQLAQGVDTDTSNLTVTNGRALLDRAIRVTHTNRGRVSTSYFVPVVGPSWQPGQPVSIVLQTGNLENGEEGALANGNSFTGIARDVMWEGLGRTESQFFTTQLGLTLADPVVLIDYNASRTMELVLSCIIMGISLLVLLGVAVFVWRRSNARV